MKTLHEYDRKRDFKKTPEPVGKLENKKSKNLSFVVQEHHASHLHYDFRLELDGVLKSWAVPKGPSPDPKEKRLAMQVEDHPLAYGKFEGMIPEKEYGGGEVLLWDQGTWEPTLEPHHGLKKGHLDFILKGTRMKGRWTLIRTGNASGKPSWLLFKRSDEFAGKDRLFHAIKKYGPKTEAPKKVKKTLNSIRKMTQKSKNKFSFIEPELSLLVDEPPKGSEWVHEIKFDGYRIQAIIQNGEVKLFTRSGKDWTNKYKNIANELKKLDLEDAILDGEIVALDQKGHSNFQDLQLAMKNKKSNSLKYYVFDLMACDGEDLRSKTLLERKEKLGEIIPKKNSYIKLSTHLEVDGKKMLSASCEQDLEGIISKRKDALYTSGRSAIWVKSKCTKRQEFVIGGYTEPQGARNRFGALLLGVYEDKKFRYVGRCGTGFSQESIEQIWKKLKTLKIKKTSFEVNAPKERENHYIRPKLVAEVVFANWTKDNLLRVPVFQGLREDKAPEKIIREKVTLISKVASRAKNKNVAIQEKNPNVRLTHPDKIIYTKEKIKKKDIAHFYQKIERWILPQIKNRPLSLMRCPEGTSKTCFYQKHFTLGQRGSGEVPAVHEIIIEERSGNKSYATVDSTEGITTLVQSGGFEFHAWGCRTPEVEHPDQIVMDFDPSPEVNFKAVKIAALELKEILDHLKLKSYLKVTGGKGLHVHIPIAPIYSWDQVKEFSKALAKQMEDQSPTKYTATLSKAARTNKIFVDYLRNGRSSTAVVPYSLRAHAISSIAMPIAWTDLPKLKSANGFTLKKAIAYLQKRKIDPWKGIDSLQQKISFIRPCFEFARQT